jgi:hypothetical protein
MAIHHNCILSQTVTEENNPAPTFHECGAAGGEKPCKV